MASLSQSCSGYTLIPSLNLIVISSLRDALGLSNAAIMANIWPWLLAAVVLGRLAYLRYYNKLNKFDGPFLASFTNLWRAWNLCGTKNRMPIAELHERYGEVVRIGPNVLSFSNPDAIKEIYNKSFVKVRFRWHNRPQNVPILRRWAY